MPKSQILLERGFICLSKDRISNSSRGSFFKLFEDFMLMSLEVKPGFRDFEKLGRASFSFL
jgi:hypothetical protein